MNKDQVKGTAKQVEGKVKEKTGQTLGNKEMEVKGKVKNQEGKIQGAYGDAKNDVKK
ncbi:CsbD family protein [Alcanivorax sp. JB21]|uniref:CsbD family protein n=1 Tax=Alcanivorax limicola TaxID=2874102 RepID=UPI001CBEB3B2|nr:CsbD family protein [Alcanivorax limicola]MBZ2190099.1 CsbD family protein [Alcanivorax limicola]